MLYIIGVAIVAVALGTEFSPFAGWVTLGGGLIFAGIWNAATQTKET